MTSKQLTKQPKIIWIDDDFFSETISARDGMNNYRTRLEQSLKINTGFAPEIVKLSSGETILDSIWDHRDEGIDLIILDLDFIDSAGEKMDSTGFTVLEKFKDTHSIPIVILSDYIDDGKRFESDFRRYENHYLGAFSKRIEEFESLLLCVTESLLYPAITLVLVSDLHSGFIEERTNSDDGSNSLDEENFRARLVDEFESISNLHKPDYFIASGDFAWKNQSKDLAVASQFVNDLRRALKTNGPRQFHFCPGNHDVSLNGVDSWRAFHGFAKSMETLEPDIGKRFGSYRLDGAFESFRTREDVLSIEYGKNKSVIFACLNSVALRSAEGGEKYETFSEIGDQQMMKLSSRIKKMNLDENQLRIAVLHHPIFAAPADEGMKEDKAISDQSTVVSQLAELGFQLIVHGHTHYSCIWDHRFAPINQVADQGAVKFKKINVIGVPTLAGDPSQATPSRQFLIVRIGQRSMRSRVRLMTVQSKVYDWVNKKWSSGRSMPSVEIG